MNAKPVPMSLKVFGLLSLLSTSLWAAEGSGAAWRPESFGATVLATVVFGALGIALAIVGFKVFDACIKFDLEREICEKQNLAVAILSAGMIIGICIIVAATLLS